MVSVGIEFGYEGIAVPARIVKVLALTGIEVAVVIEESTGIDISIAVDLHIIAAVLEGLSPGTYPAGLPRVTGNSRGVSEIRGDRSAGKEAPITNHIALDTDKQVNTPLGGSCIGEGKIINRIQLQIEARAKPKQIIRKE